MRPVQVSLAKGVLAFESKTSTTESGLCHETRAPSFASVLAAQPAARRCLEARATSFAREVRNRLRAAHVDPPNQVEAAMMRDLHSFATRDLAFASPTSTRRTRSVS
jgi:hypothetical protein